MNDKDWNWPEDVKIGDTVIVPIPGKDGKNHDHSVVVANIFPSTDKFGKMIVGYMKQQDNKEYE